MIYLNKIFHEMCQILVFANWLPYMPLWMWAKFSQPRSVEKVHKVVPKIDMEAWLELIGRWGDKTL